MLPPLIPFYISILPSYPIPSSPRPRLARMACLPPPASILRPIPCPILDELAHFQPRDARRADSRWHREAGIALNEALLKAWSRYALLFSLLLPRPVTLWLVSLPLPLALAPGSRPACLYPFIPIAVLPLRHLRGANRATEILRRLLPSFPYPRLACTRCVITHRAPTSRGLVSQRRTHTKTHRHTVSVCAKRLCHVPNSAFRKCLIAPPSPTTHMTT